MGIVVGMMPVMPALIRHLHKKPTMFARVPSKDATRKSSETPSLALTSPLEQRVMEGGFPRLHIELPTRWPTWREYEGTLIKVDMPFLKTDVVRTPFLKTDDKRYHDYDIPYKSCNCPKEHKRNYSGEYSRAAAPSKISPGPLELDTEAQPAASLCSTLSRIHQGDNRDSSVCSVDPTMLSVSTVPHETDCTTCSTFIARTNRPNTMKSLIH